jgi:hypothetical protein
MCPFFVLIVDALRGKIVGDEKQLRNAIQSGMPHPVT